ncbi:hypothetical protein DVH24_003145 [Malus domestica]|uniref:Uncharacterized protein n=1 Tax=Malus domestica TaxID=3750 RepID=A0A498K6U3_MALDO|nr:hypothetical protein DVH24_003145 [Malus domestica]
MISRINYKYSLVSNKSDIEFEIKYSSHCLSAKICTPFADSDLPRIVSLKAIECSENTQRMRVQVEFGDISNPWYQRPFNPNTRHGMQRTINYVLLLVES